MVYSKPTARQARSGISKIYLVPELLHVTGIPDEMRNNYTLMKDLADYTKMGVDKRVCALKDFNRELANNERVQKDLQAWGLKLASNLLTVNARILSPEAIVCGQNVNASYNTATAEWSNSFRDRNTNMCESVVLKNWTIFCPNQARNDTQAFIDVLKKAGQSIGMSIQNPTLVTFGDFQQFCNSVEQHSGVQIVMVIMDNRISQKYGAIKKLLSCQLGVLSQVC